MEHQVKLFRVLETASMNCWAKAISIANSAHSCGDKTEKTNTGYEEGVFREDLVIFVWAHFQLTVPPLRDPRKTTSKAWLHFLPTANAEGAGAERD